MTETPLDRLISAASNGGEQARLAYLAHLIGSELFLLLEEEPEGDDARPVLFDTADGTYLAVFDLEERLAQFAGGPAPYAVLSGRQLVARIAGQGIGLAVNLGALAEDIVTPQTVDWMDERNATQPSVAEHVPVEVSAPHGVPPALLDILDARLAAAEGLASHAWLTKVMWQTGGSAHLLVFVDALPHAHDALANSVAEALAFSGLEAGALDVAFRQSGEPLEERLARVGLRFDIPTPQNTGLSRDPAQPPRLR